MRLIVTYLVPMQLVVNVDTARKAKALFHSLPREELIRRGSVSYDCVPMLREIAREDGAYITDVFDDVPGAA